VIAASGTLAQIIPPSLVLIVMADQLGRSVGDMYEGAFIPAWCCRRSMPATSSGRDDQARSAPGLPPEATSTRSRTAATARHGAVLVGSESRSASTGLAGDRGLSRYMRTTMVRAGADFVVLTMSRGVALLFAIAGANRLFRLKLLSRWPSRSLRDGAAAGADLPGARHDLHRRRDADRRRRHGRDRRAGARASPSAG
jgi:hypothetical protein